MQATAQLETRTKIGLAIILLLWFAIVAWAGGQGAFLAPRGRPPVGIVLSLVLPIGAFLLLLRVDAVRKQILAISPVWLAAVHGLRMIGAGFLFLYAYNHLPGLFAHPAGWGDMLVAVLAPFAAARLATDPGFLASRQLWSFHALGVLDFVAAIGFGLGANATITEGVSTAALAQFPLLFIPAFAVPLWICLHIAAFVQIRAARQARKP